MAVAAPLSAEDIASLEAAGLGHIGAKVQALLDRHAHDRHEIEWRDAKIEKLTFEMAQLRRVKFGKKSEQLDTEQRVLFDEALDADIAAAEAQLQVRDENPDLVAKLDRIEIARAGAQIVERRVEHPDDFGRLVVDDRLLLAVPQRRHGDARRAVRIGDRIKLVQVAHAPVGAVPLR